MQDSKLNKVFILGLDGATFDIMMPMIKKGKLPTFSRIMNEGTHCILNSTVLTNSAPAWTSFATGKNPGKHSISGFFKLVPDSYQLKLLNGSDNKAKTLWEILSQYGKKSIVMNIPMTYPPKEINGLLVSGLDTPSLDCDFTYPRELKDELLKVVPDYKINLHLGGYLHSDKRRRKAIDVMLSSIRAREKAILYLMKNYPWDLFTVRFNSPDNVQHQFWRFMDKNHPFYDPKSPDILKNAIYTIYEELDRATASIINSLPEAHCTLIIMSDHGAGPRTNKTIRMNEWLKSLGYLTSKATKKTAKKYIYKYMEDGLSAFLRVVPPEFKQWLMKISPKTISKAWTYFRFPNIDWSKTKIFVGETEGIRINVKGKYPSGIVEVSEYESLRDHIINEIKKLQDPKTGEYIFKDVFKREDIFTGPYVGEFPDIIAITTKEQYNISSKISDNKNLSVQRSFIMEELHWRKVNGSHRREGIFIIRGPHIKQNKKLPSSNIIDVCPTTLYLLGLPVPTDVDGRVILDTISEEHSKNNPIQYEKVLIESEESKVVSDEYTDDERKKLADHLRGLGYME